MSRGPEDPRGAPQITHVEARHVSGVLLHFSDGSIIEIVPIPVQIDGFSEPFDIQLTVLDALRDLLRRATRSEGRGQSHAG